MQSSGRLTLKDMEVAGCPMHAGTSFQVSLAGANHDPAVHPNPHQFDIERDCIEHVSLGGGRRYCLGANLARLETQEAIKALFERRPDLKLADQALVPRSMPGFRGLLQLLVRPSSEPRCPCAPPGGAALRAWEVVLPRKDSGASFGEGLGGGFSGPTWRRRRGWRRGSGGDCQAGRVRRSPALRRRLWRWRPQG